MKSENDIERFVEAQDAEDFGFADALMEIEYGRKRTHWIWYVFPQLLGLGRSWNAEFYGLEGRDEAEAYLAHPILGQRLREITNALLHHRDKTVRQILGGIDAMKVQSCMTLFDCISPDDIFGEVLKQFYNGEKDPVSIV